MKKYLTLDEFKETIKSIPLNEETTVVSKRNKVETSYCFRHIKIADREAIVYNSHWPSMVKVVQDACGISLDKRLEVLWSDLTKSKAEVYEEVSNN